MKNFFIPRDITSIVKKWLKPQKAVIIKGARRTGKTELVKHIQGQYKGSTEYLNAEDADVQAMLSHRTIQNYRTLFSNTGLLIIDEAQVIPEIGKIVKLIVDEIAGIRVLITGSSSISLSRTSGEPLTGRKIEIDLYPFSLNELRNKYTPVEIRQHLEDRIVYGSYPEIVTLQSGDEKRMYLEEIVRSYLLKDVFMLNDLREGEKINQLLRMLAYQVGQEVSYHELGNALGMSKNTVERYLYLLKDAYVLFPVEGFQKNLRKEISKSRKWYFIDTGIRNAIISDFKGTEFRPDIGQLWENYVVIERLKYHRSTLQSTNLHFWRTYDRQEIDIIETNGNEIQAFEIKWKLGSKPVNVPKGFSKAYPYAEFRVVDKNNIFDFI